MRVFSIIEAPSNLGLSAGGVGLLASRLLQLGLAERIGATRRGSLDVPPASGERDKETGILNLEQIAAFTPKLANAVEAALDAGEFPVVLGGDCTILLGSMLALRRRGRYGLLFIDGHADFFQPEAEPKGEGASMELAWVTGRGPPTLARQEGFSSLVKSDDVVAVGFREHEDQCKYHSQSLPAELTAFDLPTIRTLGIATALRRAVDHLSRSDLEGYFIHLDVDVLDDSAMPAVDFRMPGGLSWAEFATAIRLALSSPKAVGLEVTIYNPLLDKGDSAGRQLVERLARELGRGEH